MNSREMCRRIEEDGFENRFRELYGDPANRKRQKERYLNAIEVFERHFGPREISVYSAPGRTEIGGNHTDHQHGEVLAASITKDILAVAAPSEDGMVSLVSGDLPMVRIDAGDVRMREEEKGSAAALLRGVLAGFQQRGYRTGGFSAFVMSDVLIGAGLSSSAAFETLIGTVVSGLYNEGTVSAVEIAKIGQYAENAFFGKPCGLMDQMACSAGSLIHIDFADPEDPAVEKLEYDFAARGYHLCITDTGGSHADLTADYAAVPEEMRSVAAYFGKSVLRELTEEEVVGKIPKLREACGDRAVLRALHFFEENKRVQREAEALKRDDINSFLSEVSASGASSFRFLQNVYTTRDIRHQNLSLALQLAEMILDGRGAARVHGGGFAGTMQAWVPTDLLDVYVDRMDAVFGEGACSILGIRSSGGICVA